MHSGDQDCPAPYILSIFLVPYILPIFYITMCFRFCVCLEAYVSNAIYLAQNQDWAYTQWCLLLLASVETYHMDGYLDWIDLVQSIFMVIFQVSVLWVDIYCIYTNNCSEMFIINAKTHLTVFCSHRSLLEIFIIIIKVLEHFSLVSCLECNLSYGWCYLLFFCPRLEQKHAAEVKKLKEEVAELRSLLSQMEKELMDVRTELKAQRESNNRAPTTTMKNLVERLKNQLALKEKQQKVSTGKSTWGG